MSERTPVEEVTKTIWQWLGQRWGLRLAVILVAVAALTWITNTADLFQKLRASLETRETYATPDEITCLNEWVLRLAATDSQTQATQIQTDFLKNYQDFGHVNRGNEPIWKNDVHVVRDIQQKDKWLVVIDMYPGASSAQCMKEGQAEMLAVLNAKPEGMGPGNRRDWYNRLGRLLTPAEPLCYDFAKFEAVNGKIQNRGSDMEYQRGLGPCGGRLTRPASSSCTDRY
jgi:hypothetical protein